MESSKTLLLIIVTCLFFIVSNPSLAGKSTFFQKSLRTLEASSGGRIGVYAINTGNHVQLGYRANERFPTGCTSKVIGVATILHQSMNDNTLLSQKITYSKKDLTNWNPIMVKIKYYQ